MKLEVGGRFKSGGNTYIYLWLIYVDIWQKPTQQCKTIILQLKVNKLQKPKRLTSPKLHLLFEPSAFPSLVANILSILSIVWIIIQLKFAFWNILISPYSGMNVALSIPLNT